MKNRVSFKDKYLLSISEYCTSKEIASLLDISLTKAREIKRLVQIDCEKQGISVFSSRVVPTEVLLKAVGKDVQYFYDKMLSEREVL